MRLTDKTLGLIHSPIGAAYALLERRTSTRDLLDLSQAAPSFPTAPPIAARVAEVAHEPDGGFYVAQLGLPGLREAFAAELSGDYSTSSSAAHVDVENVAITAGCNQAFCMVASALAEPGDNMVLSEPHYFNHDMWLRLEGIGVHSLSPGADHLPDVGQAAALIDDHTRAIILVSPGNPTGVTIPPERLRAFLDLARDRNVALILDETYRNFRGVDTPAHDLFAAADWPEHLVSLHSFSKDLAIPGYRVGSVVASPALIAEALKLVDCVAICAPRVGQEAALAGLRHAGDWRVAQAARIEGLHHHFRSVMHDRPGGFDVVTSGAYFGWVRHPFANETTASVVERLVLDHDVLAIPGTAFTPTDESMIRFSFANLDETRLGLMAERLAELS